MFIKKMLPVKFEDEVAKCGGYSSVVSVRLLELGHLEQSLPIRTLIVERPSATDQRCSRTQVIDLQTKTVAELSGN